MATAIAARASHRCGSLRGGPPTPAGPATDGGGSGRPTLNLLVRLLGLRGCRHCGQWARGPGFGKNGPVVRAGPGGPAAST